MVMLMNRYEPAALTTAALGCVSTRVAVTRAPARFRPRTSRRTGLMVCAAHQLGGSTFKISGAPSAAQVDTMKSSRSDDRVSAANGFRLCDMIFFKQHASID